MFVLKLTLQSDVIDRMKIKQITDKKLNIFSDAEKWKTFIFKWYERNQVEIDKPTHTFIRFGYEIEHISASLNIHNDVIFIVNDISKLNISDVIPVPILFSWLKNYIWQLSDG